MASTFSASSDSLSSFCLRSFRARSNTTTTSTARYRYHCQHQCQHQCQHHCRQGHRQGEGAGEGGRSERGRTDRQGEAQQTEADRSIDGRTETNRQKRTGRDGGADRQRRARGNERTEANRQKRTDRRIETDRQPSRQRRADRLHYLPVPCLVARSGSPDTTRPDRHARPAARPTTAVAPFQPSPSLFCCTIVPSLQHVRLLFPALTTRFPQLAAFLQIEQPIPILHPSPASPSGILTDPPKTHAPSPSRRFGRLQRWPASALLSKES